MPPVSGGCAGLRGAGRGSRLLVPAAADGRGEVGVRGGGAGGRDLRVRRPGRGRRGHGQLREVQSQAGPVRVYTIYTIYNLISSISTIYIYTRWRPLPDMCRPRRGHVAVVLEGVVFVLGGDTDTCEW